MEAFLTTERLVLRRLTAEDAVALYELDLDPEVRRYVSADPPDTLESVRQTVVPKMLSYYPTGYGYWAAIEQATSDFIGWFHLRPAYAPPHDIELGYRLKRSAWGHGYATEGSRQLIRYAFEVLGIDYVMARALKANTASWRVMEKLGFEFEEAFIETRFSGPDKRAVRYGLKKARTSG